MPLECVVLYCVGLVLHCQVSCVDLDHPRTDYESKEETCCNHIEKLPVLCFTVLQGTAAGVVGEITAAWCK